MKSSTLVAILILHAVMVMGILSHSQAVDDNFPKCCDKCDSWSGYQFYDDVGPRCRHGCANCQGVQMRPVKTFRCGDGRPVFDGQGTPTPCPPPCKKH
ncbi:uncharacterized protein LOC125506223 isoform X1 [Triticum urartu]|uniref:Bowman-Birk serine protease inhibitors family domain-containing protein n=1 Tax=Triticum urartu TaxID=4572 RepID=A0A8R7UMT3_TRIUA|nr:uncharacterized protein LOC125506223 isoform X1 [Triticum urartu]